MEVLDARFEKLKLVNFNALNDEKRGCFSLVFRAHDRVNDSPVAIKFYDIDPVCFYDDYRRAAFLREHEILQLLLNKERCLQLASALSTFNFTVPTPGGNVTIPCKYFAVEWIEDDIDAYFLAQETFGTIDKLHLFNEILLSVEMLHRYEVFHRDIKPDNLRTNKTALKRLVIAIDMGTSARYESGYLQREYLRPVGALPYAAPEAICGLAAHRKLAPYTHFYAF